jgi:hypothetical protein
MRLLKVAAAAAVLAAVPVSASAQYSGLYYHSQGHCEAQLKKIRKANTAGASLVQLASWDAAYCGLSGDVWVFVFPI